MNNSANFRNDIQALRALCALTIMLSHIWLNKVSGGVDVFFVISGFFMAASLIKLEQHNKVQAYLIFWRKVLTKVMPTALLIIALTAAFAYISLYPQRADIIRSGVFSIVFLENINLIAQNSNYLQSLNKSAFQQFWALSIQFQFYLIYPLIFFFFRQKRLLILSAITLASFVYSVYLVNDHPTSAYYHPLTRLWEFCAGGIVYLCYQQRLESTTQNHTAFLAASAFFGLILFALFYPSSFNFPGFSALIPVLLACIILSNQSSNTVLRWLQQNPFLLWLSQFSFTLYLVHWPVYIFAQYISLNKKISLSLGLLIMLMSIVIAYSIFRCIEKPISRKLNKIRLGRFYLIITCCTALMLGSFVLLYIENKSREQHALAQLSDKTSNYSLLNNVLAIRTVGVSLRSRQECMSNSSDIIVCDWGDPEATKRIAVIGGSHIEQWIPLFDEYGKSNHFKVLQITKVDCPLGGAENSTADCISWSERVTQHVANDPNIDYIFTNSTRTFNHHADEIIPDNYLQSFKQLQDQLSHQQSSAKLLGVRDNPRFKLNPNYCLTHLLIDNQDCLYDLNRHMAQQDPAQQYSDVITPVDFTSLICEDSTACLIYQDDIPIYTDDNHLSYLFVNAISDQASEIIDQAIQRAHRSSEQELSKQDLNEQRLAEQEQLQESHPNSENRWEQSTFEASAQRNLNAP